MVLTKAHVRNCPHFSRDILSAPNASMDEYLSLFDEREDDEIDVMEALCKVQDYIKTQRKKLVEQLKAQNQSSCVMELRHSERQDAIAAILPESGSQGGFRVSFYNVNGPLNHDCFPTGEDALFAAIKGGYWEPAPGALDKLTDLATWRRGVLWTALIMKTGGNPTEFLRANPGYLDS